MAAAELSNVLEPNEIDQIPEEIRNKFSIILSQRQEEIHQLKSKHEKLRVNSEQQYFDIEKQLITSNGKLEAETTKKNSIQEKFQDIEKRFAEATKNLQELQEKKDSFQSLEHEYTRTINLLETEKRDLNTVATKRDKDIERLNAEIEELKTKVTAASNEKCEAQVKLGELQSSEVSREYHEKRLEAEKVQLEKQVAWFEEQLTEKTNQLSNVRKEKTSNVLELQSALEEKTQELTHQQAIVETLKESLEKQGERLEQTFQKLKEEREGQVQIEEQFRQELAVQKRLVNLYKASSDENEEQITELTGAVEELRKMLKDSSEACAELESKKAEEARNFEVTLKEKEEIVSKLQADLKNADELMAAMKKGSIPLSEKAVESLSPSAAATSKLLKSGMSLTQIYGEYVQATEALREEREENKRINSYMEQIFQEIEEKAPLLKKQREDYETALQNLEQMTAQLDSVMLESEKLRADNDDLKRKYGHIQRECSRYQQSCQDLSKQVQRLLKENEELRGGRVVRDDMDVSSTEVSSSSLITEKLVTFRSIEELQKQNANLIEVCRELSEKREKEESEETTEKMQEMKEQLEFATSELDHLKDTRTRQAEMVESIVRQRDMYRVLLQQGGSLNDVPSTPQVTSTPKQPTPTTSAPSQSRENGEDREANRKELIAAREALKELKAEFDAYKKDRAENERLLNESSEKIKQNLSDMRVSNTKLTTQLNFATERYKIVQDNVAGYKKEINLLQDRNHLQASTIHKHESALAHLKEELMGAKENVARWQVQVENLKKEKELLKNAEKRLAMEVDSIRREHSAQAMLTASLQAIQNNLERSEFEARTRHTNQIEGLERELAHRQRRLETLLEERTQQSTSWEGIVKTVHLELKHEKEKAATIQTKADNAVLELETVKQELNTCEAKLAAAETKLQNLATSQDNREEDMSDIVSRVETEAVKDLKNQIAQDQIKIKSLRQQLEAAKKHENQFKAIADGAERSMKEQEEATKEVEKACEKKIQEAQAERATFERRVEILEQDLDAANAENARLTTESSSLHGDLRKQLTSLQHELEEAVNERQAAVTNSEIAQQDCKKQAEIASQAQDKYQRELMLHAADVEALAAVRKQLEDIQEHLQQTQEETTMYEKQLADAKTSWAEQERVYKEEVKIVEVRCEELTKQNSVLHEQMGKLSSQVVSIQQRARRESGGGANTSFSDEQGKTSDQLLEVVKFLRREKEISETKLQVVETECTRVKQRLSLVEKQAEEATKALAEERQHAQVNAETAANQLELMRKVSNFNVLSDSNKLLRDERDQLLNSKQELEAKIRQLESDIEPLQGKVREAESEKDTLTVERDALQEEVNRWKDRTTNLIEKSNKTDPEEYKRLLQEKENMRKQLAQVKEELSKYKNELSRITNQCTSQQTEVTNLKEEAKKASQELNSVKNQLEEKTKDCEQRTLTINRLKQIGRKYKEQADKINKELEDVKVRAATQESDKVNVASLQTTITELNSKITMLESQLTEAQNDAQATTKRAEQMVAENTTLKEAQAKKEEEMAQSRTNVTKLQAEIDDLKKKTVELDELKKKTAEFDKKTAEFDKKTAQSRQVMQSARSKILEQQNSIKQLEVENAKLKKIKVEPGAGSSEAATSQDESALRVQNTQLQTDLEEARKSTQDLQVQLDRLQTENAELIAKVHQLQRQLDHKHSPSQQGSGASSSDAPKTANIKPMAPASSSSRQTAPSITSHPAHSSHSPAAVKATASIRPMAISPTTSSLPVSGTPTATVMPTTVSQTEVDTLPGPSGLQQSTIPAVPVSGRVQIVEPQVIERNTDTSGDQNEEVAAVTNQAVVTPSVQQEAPPAASPITQVVNPVTPTPALPSTSTNAGSATVVAAAAVEAMPSQQQQQQQQQHTTGVALGKRARDEDSFTSEETDSKRTRITTQDHPIPTITVIDENQQLVTQIQPQQPSSSSLSQPQQQQQSQSGAAAAKPTAAAAPAVTTSTSAAWQADSTREDSSNSREDDVIMVLSDEDDQQVDDEDQAEDDGDEEDYEDDDDEDEDEEEDEDIEEADDPDEVEIIDADESNQAQSTQAASTLEAAPYRPSATLQPLSASQGGERLTQDTTRTRQIAPFMLGTQGLLEEDDCTVPSTPTLSQPRRGDGFAEALNSPAVNQRFLFGADSGNNPDLAQLESQRALGVDDTRMDLSQFDETSGRSLPSTPTVSLSQPDSFPTESQEDEDAALQEAETQDYRPGSGDQGGEEEDDLLEGEGDPEEEVELEAAEEEARPPSDPQGSGEGSNRPTLGKEESETSNQEKPEGAAKPQIKKIVWDAPSESSSGAPSSSSSSAPLGIGTVLGGSVIPPLMAGAQAQQVRTTQGRAQGLRRGGPTRGRGGPYWGPGGASSQGASRGPFSYRAGRGGRGFRGH